MGKVKTVVQKLKHFLIRVFGLFLKSCIVFESFPPFSDNTRAVYDEFVRRGLGRKYRLVWYLDDDTCANLNQEKAEYWDPKNHRTIRDKIRNISFYSKTKAIICCNRFLPSSGWMCPIDQNISKSFYLSHGTPLKRVDSYYHAPEGIDYALAPSKEIIPVMARAFHIEPSKFFVSGFPRNDYLINKQFSFSDRIGQGFSKTIVWYPTFRQHQKPTVASAGGYAMPLIHEKAFAEQLNETARKNKVLLLFKPHFVQNRSYLHDLSYSNLWLIDDEFFSKYGITSYELIAGSDALITDYSSVYFDYTLCDKPIAVIWEDIKEYQENPGFVIDLDKYMIGAEKIYTIDELCGFIERVAVGIDVLQTERRKIRELCNDYLDNGSTKRAVDFIVEKARL